MRHQCVPRPGRTTCPRRYLRRHSQGQLLLLVILLFYLSGAPSCAQPHATAASAGLCSHLPGRRVAQSEAESHPRLCLHAATGLHHSGTLRVSTQCGSEICMCHHSHYSAMVIIRLHVLVSQPAPANTGGTCMQLHTPHSSAHW